MEIFWVHLQSLLMQAHLSGVGKDLTQIPLETLCLYLYVAEYGRRKG